MALPLARPLPVGLASAGLSGRQCVGCGDWRDAVLSGAVRPLTPVAPPRPLESRREPVTVYEIELDERS